MQQPHPQNGTVTEPALGQELGWLDQHRGCSSYAPF